MRADSSKSAQSKKRASKPVGNKVKSKAQTIETTSKPKVRQKKIAEHSTFKLTKKRIRQPQPLPGIFAVFKNTVRLVTGNKGPYLRLTLLYSALVFVFIKGFGTTFDIVATKNEIDEYLGSSDKSLETSYTLFSYLLGSVNSQASEAAGVYQLFLTIFVILASIWMARELTAGRKVKVKYAFYRGMYPLAPFILVLLVISIQLIPAAIGNLIFSIVIEQGLALTFVEKVLWFLLFASGLIISGYMVLSSIFALNVVSLAEVTPLQALRSARGLVLHRRLGILARMLVPPIVGLLLAAIVFIPILMFIPIAAEPLFLIASAFGLIFMTTYMYQLYRSLL